MTPPPQARTRLAVDTRREQLVRAGVELLRTRTPDDISIDDVARHAGVSRGLLYHYFADRDAFVVAVVEQASEALRQALRSGPELEGRERVAAAIDGFITFAEAHAAGFRALLTGALANPKVAAVVERTRERDLDALLAGTATPGEAARSDLLRVALHAHMHFMEGAVVRWLARREITRDELRELILRTLDATVATARAVAPVRDRG